MQAQPGGALVAERPARDAACNGAEEHREIVDASHDHAVREMTRDRAEGGASRDSDEHEAEDGRGRPAGEVLRVLLDDDRSRFSHTQTVHRPPGGRS